MKLETHEGGAMKGGCQRRSIRPVVWVPSVACAGGLVVAVLLGWHHRHQEAARRETVRQECVRFYEQVADAVELRLSGLRQMNLDWGHGLALARPDLAGLQAKLADTRAAQTRLEREMRQIDQYLGRLAACAEINGDCLTAEHTQRLAALREEREGMEQTRWSLALVVQALQQQQAELASSERMSKETLQRDLEKTASDARLAQEKTRLELQDEIVKRVRAESREEAGYQARLEAQNQALQQALVAGAYQAQPSYAPWPAYRYVEEIPMCYSPQLVVGRSYSPYVMGMRMGDYGRYSAYRLWPARYPSRCVW
jgi:hypothetical protein